MFLRIDQSSPAAELDAADADERWELRSLTTGAGITLALHGPDDATADDRYDLRDDQPAASFQQPPAFAHLVWLDGPRDETQSRADEFDGRARIWPAIRDIPGIVRMLAGVRRDGGVLAVILATDTAALDRARKAIKAAPLLPSEDPALLAAPDRDEIYAVTAVPAPTTAPV